MWHTVSYDRSIGLVPLVKRALGKNNADNFNTDITQARFPLKGTDVRKVKARVEAYLDGETREQGAKRLADAGHIIGSTGDLAGFLHDHPDEVAKWGWVDALSEDSRWTDSGGNVGVPCAYVDGADRDFLLFVFRDQMYSDYGVLVLGE